MGKQVQYNPVLIPITNLPYYLSTVNFSLFSDVISGVIVILSVFEARNSVIGTILHEIR